MHIKTLARGNPFEPRRADKSKGMKTGRPRKQDHEARNKRLHIMLTQAEHVETVQRAEALGFSSLSDFVRSSIFNPSPARPRSSTSSPKPVFTHEDRRALVNLGNNLNQLARAHHSAGGASLEISLEDTIMKLDALFDRYLP